MKRKKALAAEVARLTSETVRLEGDLRASRDRTQEQRRKVDQAQALLRRHERAAQGAEVVRQAFVAGVEFMDVSTDHSSSGSTITLHAAGSLPAIDSLAAGLLGQARP